MEQKQLGLNMAYSLSTGSAQAVLKCKLCETEPSIKWRCLDCDFFMCNRCKDKIHAKFKHAKNHIILDINDIEEEKGFKIKRQFDTELNYCDFLAVCSAGTLWIGEYVNGRIHKVKIQGNILKRIQTIKSKLSGIQVLTKCKQLLLADRSPSVKIVDYDTGQISDSKYNAGSLNVVSLHITCDVVIVGAISPGEYFPVSGRRIVILFNEDGHQEATFGRDSKGNRLFSVPFRITCTTNKNIFIVDGLSDDGVGRIVVLSWNGEVKNIYNGISSNMNVQFKPVDLTKTFLDKIIVCDLGSESFHILDNTGIAMSCVKACSMGIHMPFSIDLLDDCTLYIGSVSSEGNKNAKLYEVELQGY